MGPICLSKSQFIRGLQWAQVSSWLYFPIILLSFLKNYVLGSHPDMAQRWANRGVKLSILLEMSVMNSSARR